MKNFKNIFTVVSILFATTFVNAQTITYSLGSTEYIQGEYYSTTGKPKVVRSAANKKTFLKSRGYSQTPDGYEIDHIIPLSQGGSDDPSNMQLLTVRQHSAKTARERSIVARSKNYSNKTNYSSPISSYIYKPAKTKRFEYKSPSISVPSYKVPSYSPSSYSVPSSSSRTIHTGSRGGTYYINSNGNKTYVKKSK